MMRSPKPVVIVLGALVLGAAWGTARAGPAERAAPADPLADRRTPVVRAVERSAPSVVNISTKEIRVTRPLFDDRFRDLFPRDFGHLFRPRRYVANSLGSGAVVSPRGYIVTNTHVVDRADEILVTLNDGRQMPATLVSADPDADIAVIKVEAEAPLPAIALGSSGDLMIGETVIAVGNPFGYQHSVTTGVVSATDRTLRPAANVVYEGLIQTDAPINPGNSGGPLLNIRGELIGINTAIRAGAQGLGFAIPVDRVREIMLDLLSLRHAGGAWLGVRLDARRPDAVRVAAVDRGSPAEDAGIAPGDEIVTLNSRPLGDPVDFEARLLDRTVGDVLRLGVRSGGRLRVVQVRLVAAPVPDGAALARRQFGFHFQALTADIARAMRLRVREGLLVAGVDPESPAAAAGFQSGDVVVMIDRYPIADLATLGHLLAQVDRGDRILFVVVRGRTSARVVLAARVGGEDDAEAEAEAADAPAGGGATEGAPAEDAAGTRSRADE